jgi:hypothetical protein
MNEPEAADIGPRTAPVLGLQVPAETRRPVSVVLVRASSVAFSNAIGGGILDDALTGACEGGRYGVYLDLDRETKNLPANDRAAVLLARLSRVDRAVLAGLRGDTLFVGTTSGAGTATSQPGCSWPPARPSNASPSTWIPMSARTCPDYGVTAGAGSRTRDAAPVPHLAWR